jgi:hypothetical protein
LATSQGIKGLENFQITCTGGKILALLALDAPHHQLVSGAPTLRHVHCLGVAVADSWTGETIAAWLKHLIAQLGRPAAYLKDHGSELHKAAALLEDDGLGSPCIDDISHAAASMLKRTYHPNFAQKSRVSILEKMV